MKKVLSFQVQKPKSRNHYMLFCENTPFTPKVVQNKTLYKRKQKHSKRGLDES